MADEMGWSVPPLFRSAVDVLKSWQFYAIALALMLLGVSIQRSNPQQRSLICEAYQKHVEPVLREQIDRRLKGVIPAAGVGAEAVTRPVASDSAATRPASGPAIADQGSVVEQVMLTIRGYFCPNGEPRDQPDDVRRVLSQVFAASPGATLLAFLISGLLPIASKRSVITERVENALALTGTTSAGLEDLGRVYPIVAVTARQMRLTLQYAILSGLATFLVHPQFAAVTTGWSAFVRNVPHLSAIGAVAAGSAVYGLWGFSKAKISTPQLAARLGFGPIFFGGLIASAISAPYQLLRPDDMAPLSSAQLAVIVTVRLLILPVVAALVVVAARPLFRAIEWP